MSVVLVGESVDWTNGRTQLANLLLLLCDDDDDGGCGDAQGIKRRTTHGYNFSAPESGPVFL